MLLLPILKKFKNRTASQRYNHLALTHDSYVIRNFFECVENWSNQGQHRSVLVGNDEGGFLSPLQHPPDIDALEYNSRLEMHPIGMPLPIAQSIFGEHLKYVMAPGAKYPVTVIRLMTFRAGITCNPVLIFFKIFPVEASQLTMTISVFQRRTKEQQQLLFVEIERRFLTKTYFDLLLKVCPNSEEKIIIECLSVERLIAALVKIRSLSHPDKGQIDPIYSFTHRERPYVDDPTPEPMFL